MIARLQWIHDANISISAFCCCTMCDKEDNSPNSNFKISHHFLSYISIVCSKRRQWMYLKCIISHSRIWYRKLPHYPQSVRIIRSCSMQWRCAVRRPGGHPPLFISLSPSHTIDINWTLNQNMTIFPLFVKITEFRPTTPTTSDYVWSLHSVFMIAFYNWIMLSAARSYYTGINSRILL